MEKSRDAFRTISEVAEWLGIQAHVLRFWESKFTQVKPVKRAGGRRYYRPVDMELLGGIKKLLHDDGLTIKGVQKILREQGIDHVSAQSQPLNGSPDTAIDIIPVSSEPDTPEEAKVLSFRNRGTAPAVQDQALDEPTDDPADSAPIEVVESRDEDIPVVDILNSDADPDQPELSSTSLESETDSEAVTPEGLALDLPTSDAANTDEMNNAPDSDPDIATAEATGETEQPSLPSFLHRPVPEPAPKAAPVETPAETVSESPEESVPESASDTDPVPETVAAATPDPIVEESAGPVPRIIEAPDPPQESEIAYVRGPLGHIAALTKISPEQAVQLAPVVEELKVLCQRMTGA